MGRHSAGRWSADVPERPVRRFSAAVLHPFAWTARKLAGLVGEVVVEGLLTLLAGGLLLAVGLAVLRGWETDPVVTAAVVGSGIAVLGLGVWELVARGLKSGGERPWRPFRVGVGVFAVVWAAYGSWVLFTP